MAEVRTSTASSILMWLGQRTSVCTNKLTSWDFLSQLTPNCREKTAAWRDAAGAGSLLGSPYFHLKIFFSALDLTGDWFWRSSISPQPFISLQVMNKTNGLYSFMRVLSWVVHWGFLVLYSTPSELCSCKASEAGGWGRGVCCLPELRAWVESPDF